MNSMSYKNTNKGIFEYLKIKLSGEKSCSRTYSKLAIKIRRFVMKKINFILMPALLINSLNQFNNKNDDNSS